MQIVVNVTNPQEVKTTMSSYTTYTVRGEDKQGNSLIIQILLKLLGDTVISTLCEPLCFRDGLGASFPPCLLRNC